MIRNIFSLTRSIPYLVQSKPWAPLNAKNLVSVTLQRSFSLIQTPTVSLLKNSIANPATETIRTVTKYSIKKGKRKSVKAVRGRFYRLAWGGWIRRLAGCHKKMWKKRGPRRRRLRQHVLCNATQSRLLDSMVGSYWRRRKYYVDDPYEPYHVREEFQYTAMKPKPYFPPEQ
ncbi:hypothetical protein ABEB36_012161 [Hypothenemus hampei]|uniref:Large ribosomal subunit protein bL35m n=1 Tax=Hypothenemus hampei TaxID=57062 RepID=A0ABD1EA82_HYPHA